MAGPFVSGIDCSPEMQELRRKRLADLEEMFYGGVSSVTDRNRSVSYRTKADLNGAIMALRKEIALCDGNPLCSRRRVYFIPQTKSL